MMEGVVLQSTSKMFGSTWAVHDISLHIPDGSLTVLLGPSGCGKSTLLRLIAGLETPTAGTISINGRRVDLQPAGKRDLSMVFQSYALFPHLSVADNILFGLQVRKVAKAEQALRLSRVASMMGLENLLERKPSQLSGGQQQRVAVARAVISQRRICLMDEPLSNLDAKLRAEMRQDIRNLQQTLGLTMVYVTHDQIEAVTMADQIVLLNEGRIDQIGAPDAIYSRPATIFAAKFIGTPAMNLVTSATLNAHGETNFPEGSVVGIRPEDLVLDADGPITGHVVMVEYLGADRLVTCKIGVESLIVRTPARSDLPDEGRIRLAYLPDSVHLFDAKSGQRLTQ